MNVASLWRTLVRGELAQSERLQRGQRHSRFEQGLPRCHQIPALELGDVLTSRACITEVEFGGRR